MARRRLRGNLPEAPVTVYHVYANRSNVGDWLSARGIQALLAPLPVTELLCDEPFVPETIERDRIVNVHQARTATLLGRLQGDSPPAD